MTRYEAFCFMARCTALAPGDTAGREWLQKEIVSERVDWEKVVEVAGRHYMTTALAVALLEPGFREVLPEDVSEYWEEMQRLSAERNRRLREQILEISRSLNSVGVEPVWLKGAANLIGNLYPNPASRLMIDLDAMVPEARLEDCFQKLIQEGYEIQSPPDEDCHHAAVLAGKRWIACVELHRGFGLPHDKFLVENEEIRRNSKLFTIEGAAFRVPSPTDRATMAIAHSYLLHKVHLGGTVRFRDLHDLLLLSRSPAPNIDWAEVAHRFRALGYETHLSRCVSMTARIFGEPTPEEVELSSAGSWEWRRFLFHVKHPGTQEICELAVRYSLRAGWILKTVFSPSKSGREIRRKLFTPSIYRRHLGVASEAIKKATWR